MESSSEEFKVRKDTYFHNINYLLKHIIGKRISIKKRLKGV